MRAACGLFISTLILSSLAIAAGQAPSVGDAAMQAAPTKPETLLGPAPPYVPRNIDYSLELGLMHAHEDHFWGAGSVGVHLGRCVLTESHTCQQYLDGIVGAGAREAESYGLFLGSLRWQYVNFPDRYSPYWRVFVGAANVQRPSERGWRTAFGGGWGVTTYLHERIDLRLEARGGMIDRPFVEGVLGVQIKVDRLIQSFARRLRDFGYGTVDTVIDATGTAVKATGEIVEGVASPFTSEKPQTPPAPSK